MINVVPFELKHIAEFVPEKSNLDIKATAIVNMLDTNRELVSFLVDDKMVCLLGVNHYREGTAEVWLIKSTEIYKYKYEFFKRVKDLIDNFLFENLKLHRVEMSILAGWEKGYKWADKLGFKFEGIMKAYDTNYNDHALFARTVLWKEQQQQQ